MIARRLFLQQAGLAGAASLAALRDAAASSPANPDHILHGPPPGPAYQVAQDEAYWRRIASQYKVKPGITNLEAGFFGMMAAPVLNAYRAHIERVNSESSYFARRDYPAIAEDARAKVAAFVGAKPGEVVLTRGATEALQTLIGQYNKVTAGDVVMYADLDYAAMQSAMTELVVRRGAKLVAIDLPEPAPRAVILETYERAFEANPRLRLLLLTHCNNKTGLIIPVREIVAMAKARGADVVVDAAHSFGQVPLSMEAMGADFVGFNLHKWIGAPVGAGALYIREGHLDAIDRAHGDETPLDRIDGRVHTGTTDFAATMALPDAIAFQNRIGIENKAARLRYLRDRWVGAVRATKGVDVLTTDEPGAVGAITSFRLHGRGERQANLDIAKALLEEFHIFTTQRSGLARGDCVRVTPSLYNTVDDVDRLAEAIKKLASRG
jgi:isopenicillin-N epimerase